MVSREFQRFSARPWTPRPLLDGETVARILAQRDRQRHQQLVHAHRQHPTYGLPR
jgi:hypothetical protein